MTKPKTDAYEDRKERAFRRLGTDEPCCSTCPECRWQALEAHHVADRAFHDVTFVSCANCHRVLSDAQRDHPPKQDSQSPELEAIARFLLGLADMLTLAAAQLVEFARQLMELALTGVSPNAEARQ